jgi:hypothetical protein
MKQFIICLLFMIATHCVHAQLVVQSGAGITTTGNAVVTLYNTDLLNNGTINQAAGTGRFIFNGTANSTITGSSTPTFDVLEIAKTGGGRLMLSQGINISGAVSFTSGLLDLNTKNIILQPTALLTGESEASRITAPAGGYVEITQTLNAPSAANPGNLGAIITSAQNLGSTTIRRGHVSQSSPQMQSSISRYYDILPTNNSNLNATLRLKYLDAELNTQAEPGLNQWSTFDNLNWLNRGYTTRDASTNYVEKTGILSFSRWSLSSFGVVVPVVFSQFSIECRNEQPYLAWSTTQEQGSSHFNVERSADGIVWQSIATISAAGNSNTERNYSYTDITSKSGSLYRIMQYDLDGHFSATAIIRSSCNVAAADVVNVYPNPVQDKLWVSIATAHADQVSIRIMDAKGALLLNKTSAVSSGNNLLPLMMTGFAKGNYVLVLNWSSGASQSFKIIKQ